MTPTDILATLKTLGKAPTAAIYKRHGAGDNVFGVLTSEIARLAKKIKVDHALALKLWTTGNAEARILALQIADPEKLTRGEADAFVAEASCFVCPYLASLVARSSIADKAMRAWMKSPVEVTREMGYDVLSHRLKGDADAVSDADAGAFVATIAKGIHASPNKARYAMNNALIAIGVYKPAVRKAAIAAAKEIGKVDVDHGDTSCKTPDAVKHIEKSVARRRA